MTLRYRGAKYQAAPKDISTSVHPPQVGTYRGAHYTLHQDSESITPNVPEPTFPQIPVFSTGFNFNLFRFLIAQNPVTDLLTAQYYKTLVVLGIALLAAIASLVNYLN